MKDEDEKKKKKKKEREKVNCRKTLINTSDH